MPREIAEKPVHMAKYVRDNGGVSPLCAGKPREIDLSKATWTLIKDAVTCKKCLALLAATHGG